PKPREPASDGLRSGIDDIHEGQERPGRHDHLALRVLDVAALETARVVLAPAAVVALRCEQPSGGGGRDRIVRGHPARPKAAHRMEDRVGEVDAPEAWIPAVGSLGFT